MQPIEVITTVRRILQAFQSSTIDFLFHRGFGELGRTNLDEDLIQTTTVALIDLARSQSKLLTDDNAHQVLRAFGLVELLDPEIPVKLFQLPYGKLRESKVRPAETFEILLEISRKWRIMEESVLVLERLVVPSEIVKEIEFDDILTVELRSTLDVASKLTNVIKVLGNVNDLYEAMCRLVSKSDPAPLVTVYAASGSPLRFDFRGLGEPIKQLKHLWVESWRLIRHRETEDLIANNRAALTSLATVKQIDTLIKNGTLTEEEGHNLRERILRSTENLFEAGALPREVQINEEVANVAILEARQQKLLVGPTSETHGKAAMKKGGKRKAKPTTLADRAHE